MTTWSRDDPEAKTPGGGFDHLTPERAGRPRDTSTARAIFRGVRRALAARGMVSLTEFPLGDGRRADIIALDSKGRIVIVEVKSGIADFRADQKWRDYREWCDRFLFAVGEDFPLNLIPDDCGVFVADAHDASEIRGAPEHALPPARRRAVTLRFATTAAARLQRLEDPQAGDGALSV